MKNIYQKRDRLARLVKIERILAQYPKGVTLKEIAKKCSISISTIYRDVKALEDEIEVPIWQKQNKWGISEGYYLTPVNFTPGEAISLLQAARLLQHLNNRFDPNIYSVFMKLNTAIPPPINQTINQILEFMEKYPKDDRKIKNLQRLTQAWISQHRVKFYYVERSSDTPIEIIIDPYFIEPLLQARSMYVIGYCQNSKFVRGYNINHIKGNVDVMPETYIIPENFNIDEFISEAWDMHHWEEFMNVKLRFHKRARNSVSDTIWHRSQVIKPQRDGSIIMTLKIRNFRTFRNWIIGWGKDVEVLEPLTLKKEITNFVKELAANY